MLFKRSLPRPNVLIIIATGIIGGPGKGLFQILRLSEKLRFDYTLCNFDATYMTSGNDEFFKMAAEMDIHVHVIRQHRMIDPYMICRAERIGRNEQCNIVQTHGYKPNVIGFFLKGLTGNPWLAFAHGYTDDNRKVRTYNLLDLLVLRYANVVIAVSNSMKKLLMKKGVKSSKIKIIHNAVDKTELIATIPENEARRSLKMENTYPVIGVVGRLGPEKGQIVFLKAFQYVLREFPHATALIIGDGQERRSLVDVCGKTNITNNVIFTGHVNNIADYFQIMDLLVIPSFSEGFPNVLLESMILGIPVIATSVGGIPEIVNSQNGVLIPAGDHDRMGREIVRLLSDRAQMNLLANNARDSISASFSPERRAEKIVELYHTMLRL
jgi:glycosyltransferase involved in cell wall biosynthesis